MNLRYPMTIAACLSLAACSGPQGSSGSGRTRELQLQRTVSDSVSKVGQVDWFHFRAVEANSLLQIRCSSNTYRADVELSVTVYEMNSAGDKVRIYGEHAAGDSQLPPDLTLNIYIDRPKDLYIAVRDLMDDEASDNDYFLTLGYAVGDDGNDTFSSAEPLVVDGAPGDPTATIGRVGDVDSYTFDAPADGVYQVNVEFDPFPGGTDVDLWLELYAGDGSLVLSHDVGQRNFTRLLPHLAAGTYYLLVQDFGRNDFDEASLYGVSVATRAVGELSVDDQRASAADLTAGADPETFTGTGVLEYQGDADWFRIPSGQVAASGLKVLELAFDDTDAAACVDFGVSLTDTDGVELLAHDHVGGSGRYASQVLVGDGDTFVRVQAAEGRTLTDACAYEVTARVMDSDDPAETPPGNDSITTAEMLTPVSDPTTGWSEGRVSFRGDRDWFRVDTDNTVPRVLELFFETDAASAVDYSVSVLRDDVEAKVYDSSGADGPTHLKTSLFLPAGNPAGAVSYFYLVQDYQGDEGDPEVPYRIRTNLVDVPATLPSDPAVGSGAVFYDEVFERQQPGATTVQLEHSSLVHRTYAANTSLLAFNGPTPSPDIIRATNADGLVTLTSPWIGGYVDAQGDQDWFELQMAPLWIEGVPLATRWYYDVQIELHVGSPGSEVEYVWKLFRDENQNAILVDRPDDSNGFFASNGDPDTAVAGFDAVTPTAGSGDEFWIGDEWEGRFYLSVSDFDYLAAAEPDDDWGYDGAPYYYRVTLTYHPGVSYPQ